MLDTKRIADLLTLGRGVLAVTFVWLGYTQGNQAIELVAWLLIVSWTSDVFDGALARLSRVHYNTWVGDHDLEFDVAVAFGIMIYLVVTGFINPWIGILYTLLWTAIIWRFGLQSALGKLSQAPVYGWFILVTMREAPNAGIWMIVWILIAILVTWPRFPREVIPSFLSGFKEITSR